MAQDTVFNKKNSLNCNGNLLFLDFPIIMGILNVTPDSFFDGGKHQSLPEILKQCQLLLEKGSTIIDIGGYSSRPGAKNISEEEELKRIIVPIKEIRKQFPETIISVDTFRAEVARAAISEGASIINDISGGTLDTQMFKTVAELNVPYVLSHIQGTPQDMQQNPNYEDILSELMLYFTKKIVELTTLGVQDIIIDPGFGFGKNLEHNYSILQKLEQFNILGHPILIGLSRKSMIYNFLEVTAEEALNGTSVLNFWALLKGSNILRVHDPNEAHQCVQLMQQLKKWNNKSN